VCDLETSRMGAPYIYDVSRLRVNGEKNTTMMTKSFSEEVPSNRHRIVM